MRTFARFVAIDWSGAMGAIQKGIAVAECGVGHDAPTLVARDGGWSREAVLEWLLRQAEAGIDLLVGVDLSPALPLVDAGAYFPGWDRSPADAKSLWAMIDDASAADLHLSASGFLADPEVRRHFRQHRDPGDLFPPGRGRLRVCEAAQRAQGMSPSSCFNLVGAAQVGKSSLTGMRVVHRLRGRIPVWPFDPLPATGPAIVEIYTSIAAREAGLRKGLSKIRDAAALDTALAALGSAPHAPLARYDDHATDAILTTAWLRIAAARADLWTPAAMTPHVAATEGWTFGVA